MLCVINTVGLEDIGNVVVSISTNYWLAFGRKEKLETLKTAKSSFGSHRPVEQIPLRVLHWFSQSSLVR